MKPRRDRRRLYAIVIGLVFSAVFLALALRRIDLHGLQQVLLTSHWWPWYVLAPVIYMLGHFVRGARCRIILRPHCDLSLWTSTNVVIAGYGANNVLPARMGEVVRAYVLSRNAGVSVSLSLAVTFLERLLDGLAIILILVITGWFAPLPDWGRHLLWVAAAIFLSGAVAVALITAARPFVLGVARWATGRLPRGVAERFLGILDRASSATDCLRDGALLGKILALSVGVWLVESAMFLLILPAFNLTPNPAAAGMVMAVTNLGILVPSSPGYIGPFHYFCMQGLRMFGVESETALGYAIMAHLLSYIPVTIWGLSALAAFGVNLGAMAKAPATSPDVAGAVAVEEVGGLP